MELYSPFVKVTVRIIPIIFYTTIFLLTSFLESQESSDSKQILYAMHTGDLKTTLELYQNYRQKIGHHDLEMVQQIGLTLLDRGYRSSDPQIQLMTLFGAGISTSERSLYILEEALNHPNPQFQLIALNFLAKNHHDRSDEALNRVLGSNHLLIRLEALIHLAEKKHPKAIGQIEALMSKVDPKLLPLFPQFFAIIGDAPATRALKRLLAYPNEKVRVASILSVAKFERDDLLPQIRKLAAQHHVIQQEACAIALGMLHDETSIPRLTTLAQSNIHGTRLAALQAMYRLGKKEVRSSVEMEAKKGDLFAIGILAEMVGSEDTLYALSHHSNLQVRLNATLSLLERQDTRSLIPLTEILLHDSRDLAFVKTTSLSSGLIAWKAIPSAKQNLKDDALAFELSLGLREATLRKTLDLPAKDFLMMAEALFETHQNDLVPLLVELLENMHSSQAVALLKKYYQKAGAPLIRNYCTLALFNLKEEGPYAENLRLWMIKQQEEDFIRFRPYLPWEAREVISNYELHPEEASKLLIQAFESFARSQEDKGVDVLLDALLHGNEKNRYALAGLLVRATM